MKFEHFIWFSYYCHCLCRLLKQMIAYVQLNFNPIKLHSKMLSSSVLPYRYRYKIDMWPYFQRNRIEIEIEIMRWWDFYANEIEINFLCQYLFGPIKFNMDFWSIFTFKIVTVLFKYSHSSELWCKRICIKNLQEISL